MALLNDPIYIIRGYDPETYGSEYIKDEDVVRPPNHKFTKRIDWTNKWTWKSMAGHATYGTCSTCFDSGPVWQTCHQCGVGEGHLYIVFCYGRHQLDSITLSESLERGLQRQRADRTCIWTGGVEQFVDIGYLQTAVGRNRLLTEEHRAEIFNKVYRMLPFDERSTLPGSNV